MERDWLAQGGPWLIYPEDTGVLGSDLLAVVRSFLTLPAAGKRDVAAKVANQSRRSQQIRDLQLRPCGVLRLQAPPTNTFHLSRTTAGNAAVGTVVRHPVCTRWRLVGVATVDPSKTLSQSGR